jgi:hypothetical protein
MITILKQFVKEKQILELSGPYKLNPRRINDE